MASFSNSRQAERPSRPKMRPSAAQRMAHPIAQPAPKHAGSGTQPPPVITKRGRRNISVENMTLARVACDEQPADSRRFRFRWQAGRQEGAGTHADIDVESGKVAPSRPDRERTTPDLVHATDRARLPPRDTDLGTTGAPCGGAGLHDQIGLRWR